MKKIFKSFRFKMPANLLFGDKGKPVVGIGSYLDLVEYIQFWAGTANYKGYYADVTALNAAPGPFENGNIAVVGSPVGIYVYSAGSWQLAGGGGGGTITEVNGDTGPTVQLNAVDIPYTPDPAGSLVGITNTQDAIDALVTATDPLVTTTDWETNNPVVIKTFSDTVSAAIVEFAPEVGFVTTKKRKITSADLTGGGTITLAESLSGVRVEHDEAADRIVTLPSISSMSRDFTFFEIYVTSPSNYLEVRSGAGADTFETGSNYVSETVTNAGSYNWFRINTANTGYILSANPATSEWRVVEKLGAASSGSGYTTGTDATTELKFANNYTKHVGASEAALSGAITVNLDGGAVIGNEVWLKYNDTTAPNLSNATYDFQNSLADNFQAGQDMWMIFRLVDVSTPKISARFQLDGTPSTHKPIVVRSVDLAPDGTAPATAGTFTANGRVSNTMAFDAGATSDIAYGEFILPDDYIVGSTLRARVDWTATGSGSVQFVLRIASAPDSVDIYNIGYGSDNNILDDLFVANGFQFTKGGADLDINGVLGPRHKVLFELEVDAANTDNTLTTVHVNSVVFQYEAAVSSTAKWITSSDGTAPTAPTLTTSNPTASTIDLSWTASTDNVAVDYYQIRRSTTSGSGYTVIATVSSGLTYQDTGLSGGTAYYYEVRAIDTSGNPSAWSNEDTETTVGAAFSGVLSGITHTERAWWSMIKQRYTGVTNAFQMRRNSDSATLIVTFDSNGVPDVAAVEAFLGTALVNGNQAATVVQIYDQSGVHDDLQWGWTQGSATSTEPVLYYDTTRQIFGARMIGSGGSLTAPMGRAAHSPEILIPNGAIWFDSFQNEDNTSIAKLREHYILNTAESHEMVLHNAVPYYTIAGASLMTSGVNTTGTPEQFTTTIDGSNSYFRVQGVATTGPTNAGSHDQGTVLVGSSSNLSGQQPKDTILFEMGCIDLAGITTPDIVTIETEILADLGL